MEKEEEEKKEEKEEVGKGTEKNMCQGFLTYTGYRTTLYKAKF